MDIQQNNKPIGQRTRLGFEHPVSATARALAVLAAFGLATICSPTVLAQTTSRTTQLKAASPSAGESVESRRVQFAAARPAQPPSATNTSARRVTTAQHNAKKPIVGKRSTISRAAHGEIMAEPLPQVMYEGQFASHGHSIEPGCGVEGCTSCCDSGPMIGGPVCGAEPMCGIEPGCGIEACATCGPMLHGIAPMGCDTLGCGVSGCDTVGCDSMACGPGGGWINECYPLLLPIKRINWRDFEFFAGTQAFAGPANYAGTQPGNVNREGSASFGIHEGFNFSRRSFLLGGGISSQFGLRATHNNASGTEFTDDSRNQIFLTGGFFRRVDYGFQGGVVVDYLNDKWYYNVNLTQLRAQLGWKHDPFNEFGYQYFGSLGDDVSTATVDIDAGPTQIAVTLDPTDQHRIFYRRYFRRGGTGELFAGTTDESDGILGALLDIPLIDGVAMRTGVTYLNPDAGSGLDNQQESWNLSWGFVWYPCGSCARSPYDRPMFDVADNGTFLVDRVPN